jgi:O-antigen ligase
MTSDHEQTFGGFAGRKLEQGIKPDDDNSWGLVRSREKVGAEDRACGPVDDPNYFAQILLVVLPVGLMVGWSERGGLRRAAALLLCALVLAGVLLTYSRGGFLVLVMMLVGLVVLGYLRVKHVLIGATALTALVFAVAPGYLERMDSIRGVSDMDSVNDQAMRGRLTEMLAAWNVLMDHPLVGVGPGQYTPFYSVDYMDDPGVAFRQIEKERRAHSLYFELGAETGLLGLSLFLTLTVVVLRRLQRLRRFGERGSEMSHVATGLGLGMMAYLGTSFFLSLAFMRYWWLVVALASVAARVAREGGDPHDTGARDEAGLRDVMREAAG